MEGGREKEREGERDGGKKIMKTKNNYVYPNTGPKYSKMDCKGKDYSRH